jgi:hypothetical protein
MGTIVMLSTLLLGNCTGAGAFDGDTAATRAGFTVARSVGATGRANALTENSPCRVTGEEAPRLLKTRGGLLATTNTSTATGSGVAEIRFATIEAADAVVGGAAAGWWDGGSVPL